MMMKTMPARVAGVRGAPQGVALRRARLELPHEDLALRRRGAARFGRRRGARPRLRLLQRGHLRGDARGAMRRRATLLPLTAVD